jgi:hypothetical protein
MIINCHTAWKKDWNTGVKKCEMTYKTATGVAGLK